MNISLQQFWISTNAPVLTALVTLVLVGGVGIVLIAKERATLVIIQAAVAAAVITTVAATMTVILVILAVETAVAGTRARNVLGVWVQAIAENKVRKLVFL